MNFLLTCMQSLMGFRAAVGRVRTPHTTLSETTAALYRSIGVNVADMVLKFYEGLETTHRSMQLRDTVLFKNSFYLRFLSSAFQGAQRKQGKSTLLSFFCYFIQNVCVKTHGP